MPQPRNRPTNEKEKAVNQESRSLSLKEASDPDTLKDAVYNSLPADTSDSEKQQEFERVQSQVASARQYRDSRDPSDPIHNEPVVFLGVN
jgi:hypothetical protein